VVGQAAPPVTLPQQQLAQVNKALASRVLSVDALDSNNQVVLDHGTLQVIDNQVDSATGTIRMKAEFPNANLQLWPGQFVNVRILIDTLERVVVVPTPAVQRGPNGTFVYVVEADEKVALKPVALTMQNESEAVIATGVAAGDRIVTTGFARLKDGARVDVSAPETPGSPASPTPRRLGTVNVCAADVQKLCPGVERQGIRGCLRANAGQLSDTCKAAALAAGRSQRKADNTVLQ